MENYNSIIREYNTLLENSKYYKLKRWEKKHLRELKHLLTKNLNKIVEEHKEIIKNQNIEFEKEIQKEKDNFKDNILKIEKEKNETLKLIKENKEEKIIKNNKKYNDLFLMLDKIKNEQQLIDFLNNLNFV